MTALELIKKPFARLFEKAIPSTPAYNLWAKEYDHQPHNLMLQLDEDLFSNLLKSVVIEGKTVVDIGCGTGRHWQKILKGNPQTLTGYDVSEGMLAILRNKHPEAVVHHATDNLLSGVSHNSIDLVVSTLTIAHIKNLKEAFASWVRVLKKGGDLLLTDFHPELLSKGGTRDFRIEGRKVQVKNYVHPISNLQELAMFYGMDCVQFIERRIDEDIREFYHRQDALAVYERFKETPVIFGIHLSKL